jgi:hypothetical protein
MECEKIWLEEEDGEDGSSGNWSTVCGDDF